jgi:hypothetical protein
MTVSKKWCDLDIDSDNLDSYTNKHDDWNLVFAHHKQEKEVYPLTSERKNLDLAKLFLTADQINLNLIQCIAYIYQFICIYKSKSL